MCMYYILYLHILSIFAYIHTFATLLTGLLHILKIVNVYEIDIGQNYLFCHLFVLLMFEIYSGHLIKLKIKLLNSLHYIRELIPQRTLQFC